MAGSRVHFAVWLVAALALVASYGCTSAEPREVVSTYLEAQIDGDGDRAWELLSQQTQQRFSRERFTSDAPAAKKLRDKYISEVDFEIVDQLVDGDRAEVVVRLTGPDVVDIIQGDEDPANSSWFRVYHLIREPERGWRIELASTLPASVVSVSGIFLRRFFDVFERMIGVHERALDIFEKGLDLGDRFLDIFEKELDRAHERSTEGGPTGRTGPPNPQLPKLPSLPADGAGSSDDEPAQRPPTAPPSDSTDTDPGWQSKTVKDPMTDETRRVFWTHSQNVDGASDNLRLDIWCADGKSRVFVHTRHFHGIESDTFDFDHATARIRVSDGAIEEVRGRLSENRQSIELPDGTKRTTFFADAAPRDVRIELSTPFDGRLVGRFDLDGFSEKLDAHRNECGVPQPTE